MQNDRQIDSVGWHLIRLLQENARLTFKQLGEVIGLTAPAVAERVRRLEDAGIIKGYRAEVDYNKLGLPIMAFIQLKTNTTQSLRLRKAVVGISEVIECHCITGEDSYILKVAVTSVSHLEHLLLNLTTFGEVRTSLVLSTQVAGRIVDQSLLHADG